jgi:hypothetical protein
MSVLKVISTTSQRKNFAALACARYSRHTPTVVVLDQGKGEILDGYVEGDTWIRNENTNLLAQLRDGCDLALERGDEFIVLLDDDVTYLTMIEPTDVSYRIKSRKNVTNGDWRQVLTEEALFFIDENVDDWFTDERSMLVVSSRLFFPKPGAVIPHTTALGLGAFPSVFNDHVVWRTDRLDEVLTEFDNLGCLNYSAGVDKAGAIVNNLLGYTVGRLQWVRATKQDITGNEDSTIYDFGNTPTELRNLYRNMEDAKSLRKVAPLAEKMGIAYRAKITNNGTLNSFVRTDEAVTFDGMIDEYLRKAETKLLGELI